MTREKAIKIIKEFISGTCLHTVDQEALETLIPELKENEDERIRKILLKMAKVPRKEIYEHEGITKEQAISYLEKQKELDKMIVVSPEVWDNAISDAYENGKKDNEKQKENPEEPKIAFGDWGDKEKKEAIFTCLKYMRFIKKITNQEYNDLTEWLGSTILKFKIGDKIHLIDGTSTNYEDDCITIREIDTTNYIGEFKEGYVPIKEQNKWELVKSKESLKDFIDDFPYSDEQKEPHYTKRNALFDKCVENCDPKTVEEVNKRVDAIMNMSELSAFEQALTNFIGYWEDDEEHWPSQFVKKHSKHILDMAREELKKEQKPADLSEMMVHKEPDVAPVPTPMVADEQKPAEPAGKLSRQDYLYQLLINQLITYSDYEYLIEHKHTEWSEEDEKMLKSIIEDITPVGECPDYPTDEEREYYYSGQDKMNWLKGLSNRFNLQPKSEWSEDDVKRIKQLIYDTEHIRAEYKKRKEIVDSNFNDSLIKDCDEQITWLNNLLADCKRRNADIAKLCSNEWSEEDEETISTLINYFEGDALDYSADEMVRRIKALCPSWKPSEDDIKMLEHIIGQYEIGNKNSKVMGYLPRVEELNFLKKVLAKWKN